MRNKKVRFWSFGPFRVLLAIWRLWRRLTTVWPLNVLHSFLPAAHCLLSLLVNMHKCLWKGKDKRKTLQMEFLVKSRSKVSLFSICLLLEEWNTLCTDKSAACTRCRNRKVKCEYQDGSAECQGCIAARVQCLGMIGGLGRPATSQTRSKSKSTESDYQRANIGNKHHASSQPEHTIGESLLIIYSTSILLTLLQPLENARLIISCHQ